ncbi:transposase [Candidatus Dependentiae bacterium]|nr:transposase [Candidatus Dependentiae bacterium]
MDNASFHKNGKIKALIESAGCDLLYLPAYSPDFNPIEHQWARIKHHIRKALPSCNRNLYEAAEQAFHLISIHK